MTTMERRTGFPTEAAMCARFISLLPPEWTPYAETAGWDILLVRPADGFQIGIQAKLRLSTEVINQAIACSDYEKDGPDCRAILVPQVCCGFEEIARYIGFVILKVRPQDKDRHGGRYGRGFDPALPEIGKAAWSRSEQWHEWLPEKRHRLPEYVPDVPAGSSAPVQLTDWKIKALKIAVLLKKRKIVTRDDFRHLGLDPRRWLTPGAEWLIRVDGGFKAGPYLPDFKGQHPRVFEEIAKDAKKWMKPITGQLPL